MTRSKPPATLAELLRELDELGLRPIQPGEITAPQYARHRGCTHNSAILFLREQEKAGKLAPPLYRRGPNGRRVLAWGKPKAGKS